MADKLFSLNHIMNERGLQKHIRNEKLRKIDMRRHLEQKHGMTITGELQSMSSDQLTRVHDVFREVLPCGKLFGDPS